LADSIAFGDSAAFVGSGALAGGVTTGAGGRRHLRRLSGLGFRRIGLRLQLRTGLTLELDRLLQVLERPLELRDARLRFLQRLVARNHLFGERRGAGTGALRRTCLRDTLS
jgi:hypothetical protein